MTTATSFFNNDYILDTILDKLPLRKKFIAQFVCHRWKDRSMIALKQHKSVVLSANRPGRVDDEENCKEHPMHRQNVMTFSLYDMKSWRQVLPFLPGIQFVYLDINPNVAMDFRYADYRQFLEYIIEMYASQLQCLWIPSHEEYSGEFLKTDCFPQLRHLHFSGTSDTNLVRIIKSCPRLEYLKCNTYITEWNLLPKGFKKIEWEDRYRRYLRGMVNLLTCKASETIEEILGIKLVSDVFRNNFSLPRLNTLGVFIYEDTNGCLNNLARILRFSPVLKKLSIQIQSSDNTDASSWVKVIEEGCKIIDLTVLLTRDRPLIKVSLWQDAFAESVSLNMKQLKTLKLDFALSSIGLVALSSLPELQLFHHKLYIDKQTDLDDSFFSEEALYQFLQTHFSRKLHHYDINIPSFYPDGAYLPVSQGFVDRLIQDFSQNLGVTLVIESRRESGFDFRKNRMPGVVYLTELQIDKPDNDTNSSKSIDDEDMTDDEDSLEYW